MEHVDTVDLDLNLTILGGENVDVGLSEDYKEVSLAGVLQVAGHMEVGVHASLEHRDATELVEFRGVGPIVKRAVDQNVEVGVSGFARKTV